MTIEWTVEDDDVMAMVVPEPKGGCALLSVDRDGTLSVFGDRWRECPLMHERLCKKPRHKGPGDSCLQCAWSGKAHIGDRKLAIGVAEALAEGIVNGTM